MGHVDRRHNGGVMGPDSGPYAAIVSNKRSILLASLILEIKIGLRLQNANHAR